jgi:DNA-binding protein H-NS
MAKTYADVMAQISKLQAEADGLRKKEVAGVIARIREAIDHYGLTSADLGFNVPRGVRRAVARGKAPVAAKYSDGQGNVWGGRGPRPAWLRDALAKGRTLEEFAVGGSQVSAPEAAKPASKRRRAAATSKRGGSSAAKRGQRAKAEKKRAAPMSEPQVQGEAPEEPSAN